MRCKTCSTACKTTPLSLIFHMSIKEISLRTAEVSTECEGNVCFEYYKSIKYVCVCVYVYEM